MPSCTIPHVSPGKSIPRLSRSSTSEFRKTIEFLQLAYIIVPFNFPNTDSAGYLAFFILPNPGDIPRKISNSLGLYAFL